MLQRLADGVDRVDDVRGLVTAAVFDWAIAVIAVFPMLEVERCGRREPAEGASC